MKKYNFAGKKLFIRGGYMKTALSNYFHNIKESGRDIKIIMYSTLLIMVVLCLEIISKPCGFYNNIPKEMRITLISGACILVFI